MPAHPHHQTHRQPFMLNCSLKTSEHLPLDRTSPTPQVQQLTDHLQTWIDQQRLRPARACRRFGPWPAARRSVRRSWRAATELAQAVRQVSRGNPQDLFDYCPPLGLASLRQQLHKRLAQLGIAAGPERILTTHGASHGLDLLVRTLLRPGDTVLVENPGYYNRLGPGARPRFCQPGAPCTGTRRAANPRQRLRLPGRGQRLAAHQCRLRAGLPRPGLPSARRATSAKLIATRS